VNHKLAECTPGKTGLTMVELYQNPLVQEISKVTSRIVEFKQKARDYYFEVILSVYSCPDCGGRFHMTGQSQCSCSCGKKLDPTLAFQKSTCCGATLNRKTSHYTCSICSKIVPSRFLFNERVFDKTYFREMMQESRRKTNEKREEIRRLLAESRSGILSFSEDMQLESIPGLVEDLNRFIKTEFSEIDYLTFDDHKKFNMDDYRKHILSCLSWNSVFFSSMKPLIGNIRYDRIWRFVTLVFMQNNREIELTQFGNDLKVQRVYNEAYC